MGKIMRREIQADGTYRIDPDKLVAEAARSGALVTDWQVEEQQISMHPVQKAPEQLQQRLTDSSWITGISSGRSPLSSYHPAAVAK